MSPNQECPGRLKCHGPAVWCDVCGDVDLYCDDPECDIHLRIDEKIQQVRLLSSKLLVATDDYKTYQQLHDEAVRSLMRHVETPGIMVPRGRRAS